MTTLKGIFPELKPVRRKNFIHENVKNLHRMKNCMSMNKGMKETRKSQVQSQKKINNNYIHNYNHTKDVSPKPNINLQGKQYESCHTKGTANHKLDQQKGLCKKSSVAILNKTTTNKKKSMYLTNNTIPIKQKKEVCKESNRCNRKLQRKVLSDSNLSNTSVSDTNKNVKIQTAVRNQSIQTLDITEIDNLYSEGIIKYPSKKCLNFDESVNKNERDEKIDKPLRNVINLSADEGDTQIIEKVVQNKNDLKSPKRDCSKEETDYIKLNKERSSIIDKVVTPIKNNTSNNINTNNCKHKNNNTPANYRVGVVPKYIKNRKEALEKEQKAKIDELDPNCPSGHVPLLDHERKETLRVLRKKYQDYVNELNMLPIKADTLRAQRRKIEIEKQLNNLEEGIKVFSRPKVYVKMNA